MSFQYIKSANSPAAALHRAFNIHQDQPFLGTRLRETNSARWLTYGEAAVKTRTFASSLTTLLPRNSTVAICGSNREEWVITDLACVLNDFPSVGCHVSWPRNEVVQVLNESAVAAAVVDGPQLALFFDAATSVPSLKYVIAMEGGEEAKKVAPSSVKVFSFAELVDVAFMAGQPLQTYTNYGLERPPTDVVERPQEEPLTLIYSSGTSGVPKGISVSKKRWKNDAEQGVMWRQVHKVAVSYSALAHGMDRGIVWQSLFAGGRVGFAGGSHAQLVNDMGYYEPSFFTAMPHFWNRIYSDYLVAVKEALRGAIMSVVVAAGGGSNHESDTLRELTDTLYAAAFTANKDAGPNLATRIRDQILEEFSVCLGHHLNVIGTGGAHTSDEVLTFLRKCFKCSVVNAYGTTECPGISSNGEIAEGVTVELVDVPELGYRSSDKPFPRGEIRVRSNNMATEYFKNPEESRKAFHGGFYYTGDIGMIDGSGKLHIIDRKKNVCELYVNGRSVWLPAAELESLYQESPLIDQIYLHSERSEDCIVAVVVPEKSYVEAFKSRHGLGGQDAAQITAHSRLRYELADAIRSIGRLHSRKAYEIPRGIVVDLEPWTLDNGLLASTHKPKRGALALYYKERTDAEFTRLEKALESKPVVNYLDFVFTAPMEEDANTLNALYDVIKADAAAVRTLAPRVGEQVRAAEAAINKELEDVKAACFLVVESAIQDLISAVASSVGIMSATTKVLDAFMNLQGHVRDVLNKLEVVQTSPHPELDALQKKMMSDIQELERVGDSLGIRVPYQITAGQILLKVEDFGKGVISEGRGFPNWQVTCHVSGELIEWGAVGANTPRYHSIDEDNVNYSVRCYELVQRTYALLAGSTHAEAKEAYEVVRKNYPHPVSEPMPLEYNHPIWLRDSVVVDRTKGTPAGTISRTFKAYEDRICLGLHASEVALGAVVYETKGVKTIVHDGYHWIKYGDVGRLATNLATHLRTLVARGSFVGVSGPNSFQWALTDFACALAGCTVVGMHTTFDAKHATHVIDNAQLSLIVCPASSLAFTLDILGGDRSRTSSVRAIVLTDVAASSAEGSAAVAAVAGSGLALTLAFMADMLGEPAADIVLEDPENQPEGGPDAISTILYTSGSSGMPKGVIVTAKAFWHDIIADTIHVTPLISASYIPLSHSSDRLKLWEFICNGGRIGFTQYNHRNWIDHETVKKDGLLKSLNGGANNVIELFAQVKDLRPSGVACPPRVWNGLYHVYNTALHARGVADMSPEAAAAVEAEERAKIAAMFGDRVKFLITGGSPTAPEVMSFVRSVFPHISFHDSYGTTEAGGLTEDGMPLVSKGVELVLWDLPELGFTNNDKPYPRGEIVVKTPSLSTGYYRDEKQTAEVFVDGWYRTGDLGSIDTSGRVTIIERVSAVASLRGGEVYFPSKLEALYEGSKMVQQVFIYGSPERACLVALVVPSMAAVAQWSARSGVDAEAAVDSNDIGLHAAILADFTTLAAATGTELFNVPRAIHLVRGLWTPNDGLFNTQFKKVRKAFVAKYQNVLHDLYAHLPM